MFERMGYTQASGTIYLQEREECVVCLHWENGSVAPIGVLRRADKGLLLREQKTKRMHS